MAPYLQAKISKPAMHSLARFRLSSHHLHVETGRFMDMPYELRACEVCADTPIEDEPHVIFSCCRLNDIRQEHTALFEQMQDWEVDPEHDMRLFFQQEPRQVASFIHKCMKVYDALYLDRFGEQPIQAELVPPD